VAEQVARTRALVVEDDPNIVDLIRSNLAVRGFDTVVSTDGSRALQLLDTEEPDIVLLARTLPETAGWPAAHAGALGRGDHRRVSARQRA
jgi:two-component system KDP operon response regulator KdpE